MLFPFESTNATIEFIQSAHRRREELAGKVSAVASFKAAQEPVLAEMSRHLDRFFALGDAERRLLVADPLFFIWMRAVIAAINGAAVTPSLVPLDLDYLLSHTDRAYLREPDVHPTVRFAIPPTYIFRKDFSPRRRDPDQSGCYEQAIETALRRIDSRLPGFGQAFDLLVRNVLVLENADFRSCSADRYQGLLILGTSDQSLIEIEESLVHEFTHQILYALDDLNPLFLNRDDQNEIELPWSGSVRNFYGFLHAAHVYLVLRDYYDRSIQMSDYDLAYCVERREVIQDGLVRALPILRQHLDSLSQAGRLFVEKMIECIPAHSNATVN